MREQAPQLLLRPLDVDLRPHDRVEAGVPELLERIDAGRRHGEHVPLPLPPALPRVRLEEEAGLVEQLAGHATPLGSRE